MCPASKSRIEKKKYRTDLTLVIVHLDLELHLQFKKIYIKHMLAGSHFVTFPDIMFLGEKK